jgi:hypothetical protein
MRSPSSTSVTLRIAGWVPSLWMSQRSKCCSGPAFMMMSGGWMIGPAFMSAPESASSIGSTAGNALATTPSARAESSAGRAPVGSRVARTEMRVSVGPILRASQGSVPVSVKVTRARLPAARMALSRTKLPKVPGGRNTTWPSARCGASAGAKPACAVAGSGMTISSAPLTAAARSVVGSAMATSRRPRASVKVMRLRSSTGPKACGSRRQNRTRCPASERSAAAA